MGGEVAGQGAVGVGCCFWLDLPYDAQAVADMSDEAADAVGEPSSAGPLRVLIAEDDALGAAMLRTILEQLGHRVVHAHDGRRALELAQLCEFDLIMLDGRMPLLSGAQTTQAIRTMGGTAAATPIVAVIGGDAEEMRACLDAGADEVLRKPVTVSSVARAAAGVLNRAAQARSAA
jgi:CheY-like chemotaxis protein